MINCWGNFKGTLTCMRGNTVVQGRCLLGNKSPWIFQNTLTSSSSPSLSFTHHPSPLYPSHTHPFTLTPSLALASLSPIFYKKSCYNLNTFLVIKNIYLYTNIKYCKFPNAPTVSQGSILLGILPITEERVLMARARTAH